MIIEFKNRASFFLMGAIVLSIMPGCNSRNDEADAYGNFETSEIVVSAQAQGTIQSLTIDEGSRVEAGNIIGTIDSSTSSIKKEQLQAQKSVVISRLNNVDDQIQVQAEQRQNLVKEVTRIENLLKDNAATTQQYDDITGKLRVLDSQTNAIRSQKNIVKGELAVLDAQLKEVGNMLEKCRIVSPITGIILEKYADAGELVSPGKSLFKVADLNEMELRVYVSGTQVSSIKIGYTVTVQIDGPEETLQSMDGVVSWIASQMEFTPKIMQTREERVNMVYAVKIRVQNDGRLKIGMPGEIVWRN